MEILGGSTEAAPVAARVNVTGLNGRMKRSVFIRYVATLGFFFTREQFKFMC